MKKLLSITLVLILMLSLISCDKETKNEEVENTPEKTEAPETVVSTPDESTPQISADNKFYNPNNNSYDVNALSIKPKCVYWENGELVAECFVINGFSHNVFNINVESIAFSNSAGPIASGSGFGVLNNVTLPPYTNIVWTFRFAPDTIANYGADLSSLTCNASVSNSY